MSEAVVFAAAATLLLCAVLELVAAVLPLALVIALVKPEDRHVLAEVMAAAGCSRRMRLWSALRKSVSVRKRQSGRRPGWYNMP